MGRRWWLQVRYAPYGITDYLGMSGTFPGPTMCGLVLLQRGRLLLTSAAEQSPSPGEGALLNLEPRPAVHMVGLENIQDYSLLVCTVCCRHVHLST